MKTKRVYRLFLEQRKEDGSPLFGGYVKEIKMDCAELVLIHTKKRNEAIQFSCSQANGVLSLIGGRKPAKIYRKTWTNVEELIKE